MRIEFDASNDTELSAVFIALAVLRGGDLSLPLLDDNGEGGRALVPPPIVAAPPPVGESAPLAPPPPVASVVAPPPPALTTAPPASPSGVQVDADGLPWDARIHSTPATLKKDGKWRGRRGLDDATRATVTAELKQVMAATGVAIPEQPAPMFAESAPGVPLPPAGGELPADAATAFAAPVATPAVSPPAPPVAAAPVAPPPPVVAPPATPPGPATDFASLMRKITSLQSAGHLDVTGTSQIATSLGITGVRDLMHRPDLIPSFDALLPVVG